MKKILFFLLITVVTTLSCEKDQVEITSNLNFDQEVSIFFKFDDFKSEIRIEPGETVSCLRDVNTIISARDSSNQPVAMHWQITYTDLLGEVKTDQYYGNQMAKKFQDLGIYEVKVAFDQGFEFMAIEFYVLVEGIPGRLGDGPDNNYIFRLESKNNLDMQVYYEVFFKYNHAFASDSAMVEYSYFDQEGNQIAIGQVGMNKHELLDGYYYNIFSEIVGAKTKLVFKIINSNGVIKNDLNNYLSSWTDGSGIVFTALDPSTPPSFTCGDSVSFTYMNETVTYGTVPRGNKCWLDRNLGASRVPTSPTDSEGFGDYFQWGRLDDGHQLKTSQTTNMHSLSDVPGHGYFIKPSYYALDWRLPQNNNLWQGEAGVNNPCPPGWRVPTYEELLEELEAWVPQNSEGAFSSPLKWPFSGFRSHENHFIDFYGQAWTSSISTYENFFISSYLSYDEGDAYIVHGGYRGGGMPVRCIKNN